LQVTYPHMGYLNIPVNTMLHNLGITVVEAPPITKKTVELGSRYSPEGVCLPYKINLGNFMEAIELGANTMVTVCGTGKCRLGFYNAVQKISLAKMNDLQFHTINTDQLFTSLYRFLRQASPASSRISIVKNIALAIRTLQALDAINDAKNYYGARTSSPDSIIGIYNTGTKRLGECGSFREVERTQNMIIDLMKAASDNPDIAPVKVGIIGEFYLLLEPYVNHNIENLLITQGVEVKKFVYTGNWVYSQTLLKTLGLYNEEKAYLDQARPYLNYHVGGDGLKSVGSALWCARNKYDGIIHIYPFGCMPEVVAQYSLKNIANDHNLPILTLSIDEHSSDVGLITRVEAFIDCLKRKKKQ